MSKRSREPSISVKEIENGCIIIEYCGRKYALFSDARLTSVFDLPEYSCEILHNKWHQAMLHVENLRTGETILRQEVNPAKDRNAECWVKDVQ